MVQQSAQQEDRNLLFENNQYWNKRAVGYSEVNKEELNGIQRNTWSSLLKKKMQEAYPGVDPQNLKILDIGAGPGFLSIILAEMGYSVTAADYSENMQKEARRNAEACHVHINFTRQNAEDIHLPDETFHVVVSRNLTWNLEHPDRAYNEWLRVLKKGGLLLVFDANWYTYLYSPESRAAYEKDRENVAAENMDDYNIGSDFDQMEKIAGKLPMTRRLRPDWDLSYLQSAGVHRIERINDIGSILYSEKEKINFNSTPLFMIKAVKG